MRRSPLSCVLFLLVTTTAVAQPILAQPITVQQPVVGTFGVQTTVSVPDRGSMHLGSVNSAAASRSSYGFPRTSTNTGVETTGSSTSVGVYIHDLQELDTALLASVPQPLPQTVWEKRLAERRAAIPTELMAKEMRSAEASTPTRNVADLEVRALRAEQNGKSAVALTYWRMAAKDGSALAREKLAKRSTIAPK